MLRTALRPRWLALLGLVAAIVVLFGWLGLWQLNVSQQKAQTELLQQVEAAPEAPIDDVLPPQTSITGAHVGRSVIAAGRYDAENQVLVAGRRLGDQVGTWVLTPLVVDATGARLAIIRGFVPEGTSPPPPPPGPVTVAGTLQPQEGPPDQRQPMPEGQVQTVDLSSFVNTWPSDVYNAFVFADTETPPATGAAAQVTPVPPPAVDPGGLNWRNFAYAIQWWIFAAFVVYVWWRLVRDDYRLSLEGESHSEAGAEAGDTDQTTRTGEDPPVRDAGEGTTDPTDHPLPSGGNTR